jgi:predicted CoA-binding protein
MSEFGNGVVVAVEALQDDLDLVDVFRRAAWKPRGRME